MYTFYARPKSCNADYQYQIHTQEQDVSACLGCIALSTDIVWKFNVVGQTTRGSIELQPQMGDNKLK